VSVRIREKPRPEREGHTALPVLRMSDWSRAARWWRPELGIPQRCPTCRSRLAVEAPEGQRFGRVLCALGCAREVAYVSSIGWNL
jgi:hypothetical protein